MKIFIDCRNTYKWQAVLRRYTWQLWRDITMLHPDSEFVLITGRGKLPFEMGSNVRLAGLSHTGWPWVDRRRLHKMLAQSKASRLITLQASAFGACVYTLDSNGKIYPGKPAAQWLFGNRPPGGANTSMIMPVTENPVMELSWTAAESVKTQYTGGRSFFLFPGDISEDHQLVDLLKAFSVFKKWQQSNMQLVMAGSRTAWTETLEEKLKTYKFRNDTVLLTGVPHADMARLVAASYALVYPSSPAIFPLGLLWGIQSGKAVIATDHPINTQLADAAFWVATDQTAAGFGKAMIELYKDEKQLQTLVERAKKQAMQSSREQMLHDVWKQVEQ
jgi:glycosyltransferase involved in cell wall biosynthesis